MNYCYKITATGLNTNYDAESTNLLFVLWDTHRSRFLRKKNSMGASINNTTFTRYTEHLQIENSDYESCNYKGPFPASQRVGRKNHT